MTLQKITSLVLLMFTLVCALHATVVSPPSAIAQEDDDEEENLASGTVSNVLDNVNSAGDNTNTEVSVPITDQDQTDVNLGLSEALDVTVERTLSPQEEPPEDEDAFFCLIGEIEPFCFESLAECEEALDNLGAEAECRGFETLPEDALLCTVEGDVIRCELRPV
jgi:hypothetical protein